jgi:hypothetical protein
MDPKAGWSTKRGKRPTLDSPPFCDGSRPEARDKVHCGTVLNHGREQTREAGGGSDPVLAGAYSLE